MDNQLLLSIIIIVVFAQAKMNRVTLAKSIGYALFAGLLFVLLNIGTIREFRDIATYQYPYIPENANGWHITIIQVAQFLAR